MVAEIKSKRDLLDEQFDNLLVMDGFDDCIIGVVVRYGQDPIVCYDMEKVMSKLVSEGMEEEEAVEHFEFNIIGGWLGDLTPCFLDNLGGSDG